MQSSPPPLPVKWYLASFLGALLLACLLMVAFEILAAEDPTLLVRASSQADAPDPTKSVVTLPTAGQSQTELKLSPPVSILPSNPLPPTVPEPGRSRRLWELLVPVKLVYGALAVVLFGAIQLLQSFDRRRRPERI